MTEPTIELPLADIARLCERSGVKSLAVFGSALRDDFRPDSDLDLLVDFQEGSRIGLMAFSKLQRELSAVTHRTVDLVPRNSLKPLTRDEVLGSARYIYHAA